MSGGDGALAAASAPVTQGTVRFLLVLALLGVVGLALWAMRRGWVRRGRRQADVPAPAPPPARLSAPLVDRLDGLYVGTVRSGDWLDRIVAHGLGTRSAASLTVTAEGVLLDRAGGAELFVPATALRAVSLQRGIAGRVYEAHGVLVLTWSLGDLVLDTGFRARHTADHEAVAVAVAGLVHAQEGAA
ncbi:MAG: hypothetical protein EPO13_01290 [Actinomycetota bacterium]|nr:MAG: hypothetical protein EPO13_01290 [Actinomycetota bacterium]